MNDLFDTLLQIAMRAVSVAEHRAETYRKSVEIDERVTDYDLKVRQENARYYAELNDVDIAGITETTNSEEPEPATDDPVVSESPAPPPEPTSEPAPAPLEVTVTPTATVDAIENMDIDTLKAEIDAIPFLTRKKGQKTPTLRKMLREGLQRLAAGEGDPEEADATVLEDDNSEVCQVCKDNPPEGAPCFACNNSGFAPNAPSAPANVPSEDQCRTAVIAYLDKISKPLLGAEEVVNRLAEEKDEDKANEIRQEITAPAVAQMKALIKGICGVELVRDVPAEKRQEVIDACR